MKYLKIFEDFNENKPSSITIEVSEDFIKEKKIYKANRQIEMRPGLYYNLGNTSSETMPVEFIFVTYLPDINEIQYFTLECQNSESFSVLAKEDVIVTEIARKKLIEKTGCRYVPGHYSKFEKGFQIGEIGGQGGYFKIIDVKK